jgi:hypothetical protein
MHARYASEITKYALKYTKYAPKYALKIKRGKFFKFICIKK